MPGVLVPKDASLVSSICDAVAPLIRAQSAQTISAVGAMIEGRVANRLYCELSPPRIQVHFFDDSGLDQVLGKITLAITEPPGIEQVKHAPFEVPDIDRVPVEAQGERGFFLVLDSLPERTADFTLTAVVNGH